ncbi:MAG: hypothetical protein H6502_02820 [Candidatus Woesearchaeota archaeon]|nr:MAG: hypothetical protein H6502_02820 [Candidatus Woesearchaeota archaeon]
MEQRIKHLRPSLQEKRRYLVYEVLSDAPVQNYGVLIAKEIESFLGVFGSAKAHLVSLKTYPPNKGMLRMSRKSVDPVKLGLGLIAVLNSTPVSIRTILVSGTIKKAQQKASLEKGNIHK